MGKYANKTIFRALIKEDCFAQCPHWRKEEIEKGENSSRNSHDVCRKLHCFARPPGALTRIPNAYCPTFVADRNEEKFLHFLQEKVKNVLPKFVPNLFKNNDFLIYAGAKYFFHATIGVQSRVGLGHAHLSGGDARGASLLFTSQTFFWAWGVSVSKQVGWSKAGRAPVSAPTSMREFFEL